MGTPIYLSNDAADISGYLKAYIGFPGPNASTTVSTAVTDTAGSGSDIDMTLTAGGTVAKWITVPFASDVAIAARQVNNIWAKESNASANAQVQILLKEYTTSAQSAFQTTAFGTELTTAAALQSWADAIDTATTIDAGNRLIIQPQITNVGTMGASQTVTMDYNGSTPGITGDTYIVINELITPDGSQFNNSTFPLIAGGPSTVAYHNFWDKLQPVIQEMTASPNTATWGAIKAELQAQAGDQASADNSLQSA
jgi:hypothetical protein